MPARASPAAAHDGAGMFVPDSFLTAECVFGPIHLTDVATPDTAAYPDSVVPSIEQPSTGLAVP